MDNATLIEHCMRGDKTAMESLYCRFSMRMMRVIRRYVGDAKSAQDILHDGFVLIFTHIGEVRNPEKLEFWMGTVMKNLCLRYLEHLDLTTILDEEVDLPDIPELEDILSYEELSQLINRLPDGYRTVFKLAVLEGKSHKEIGKILGISPNTSSSQLYHAKVLLRRLIAEHKRQAGILTALLLLCVGLFLSLNKPIASEESIFFSSLDFGELPLPEVNSAGGLAGKLRPRADRADIRRIVAVPAGEMPETVAAAIPDSIVDGGDAADTDSIFQEPALRPSIPSVQRQLEVFPRKTIAHSGWTVGAHCSLGSRAPELSSLFSNSDLISDFVTDNPSANPGGNNPVPPPAVTELKREINHELPVTVGLTVEKRLNRRFGIETGLTYTYMRSHIRYFNNIVELKQTVKANFIGIPLKADYIFYNRARLSLYATAGAAIDFPVGASVSTRRESSSGMDINVPPVKYKPEISVLGGVGLHYSLTPAIGLYIEPSVRYYFPNDSPTPTYRQEHSTVLSVPIGIRFNWQ